MKALLIIVVVVVLGWAGYALFNKGEAPKVAEPIIVDEVVVTTDTEVKEFVVTGSNFAFAPSTMKVNKGDTVRIVFQNSGGNHDWVIDEFNARTKMIGSGQTETIEFVADQSGTFEYYCSVGTHRQMGMKGTLIVE